MRGGGSKISQFGQRLEVWTSLKSWRYRGFRRQPKAQMAGGLMVITVMVFQHGKTTTWGKYSPYHHWGVVEEQDHPVPITLPSPGPLVRGLGRAYYVSNSRKELREARRGHRCPRSKRGGPRTWSLHLTALQNERGQ